MPQGGCDPALTGSLCISIIILIIVIILIIMVCYNYNQNNQPPPKIQNPGAAAALAYKYGINGRKNNFMDQCGNGEYYCNCITPTSCWGACHNGKCGAL